jgi:hypothetical protein
MRELTTALGGEHHQFVLGSPNNALESAIDELASLANVRPSGDARMHVEYWARQSWMHLECHRDCDEFLNGVGFDSERQGARRTSAMLRYPKHGHVLYLDVGSGVRGPTCIFEDADQVPVSARAASPLGGVEEAAGASGSELRPTAVRLVPILRKMHVVPARSARLLRFDGSAMHGVPRPYDAYLSGGGVDEQLTRGFGAEGCDMKRQVLLFNVWADGPPLNLEPVALGTGRDSSSAALAPRCRVRDDWRGAPCRQVRPSGLWPPAAVQAVTLLVSMLGPAWRRGYHSRIFCVRAPPGVRAALCEEETHSIVHLDRMTNALLRTARLTWQLSTSTSKSTEAAQTQLQT